MTNENPSSVAPARLPDAPAEADPGPSDQSLLRRYVDQRDEAAFAALVRRYGPLVLGICRRVLGHEQDSEDAFQATFLVLARKAGAISKGDSMGGWLYRVAYRIARKLRGRQARQRMRERAAQEFAAPEETPAWVWRELGAVLDEEVNRLPEKYRLPFILCYLDGRTNEEAARRLACPVGTLASRLAWARERLRVRLTHRGVVLSAALLAGGLTAHAGPAVLPAPLADATTRAGLRFATGPEATAAGPSAQLARAYLATLAWRRLLRGSIGVLVLGVGAGLVVWSVPLLRPGRPGPGDGNAAAVAARRAAAAQDDLRRLQGVWKIDELEIGGQKVDPQGTRLAFDGHTARLVGQPFEMTFELVPSAEPKLMNLVLTALNSTPAQGIYALDGDVLRLCYSVGAEPRPTEFATHPNSHELLYVLRRE